MRILLQSAAFKLVFVVAAAVAWWVLMRLVRRSQGWPWSDVRAQIEKGNVAVALHAGLLALALALVMGLAVGCAHAADPFPTTYDAPIRDAWALYHPGDAPAWWKAQLFQESRLDPNARSPVGAEGLAQFMPATWKEVTEAMRFGAVDRRMAEPSIYAGAFYMRRLVHVWRAPRTALSRRQLAQASYNCGAGGVLSAQRRCGGAMEYEPIAPCLPRESSTYVRRIARWYGMMSL